MQLFGQINDRVLLYFQFGMNNFNYLNGFPGFNTTGTPSNRKVAAFFHDAVSEYLVIKNRNYLKIGGGLTIVNGLSRFSQPDVSNIMTMDVPVFALKDHKKQFQGLFLCQFFDNEANQTPGYMTGTYLGKKKVLNLEAGFITQQNALWHRENTADTVYQAMNLWSVASFLDMPLNREKGTAINACLGYFHTDYGQNYLHCNGIMNPASGASNVSGQRLPGVWHG